MFPGQCGNTAFFFKSQPDQFHFEFRGIVFPGKSFFSAHEVSTCKISGCLSYRILDSGPDGTQTTLTFIPAGAGNTRRVTCAQQIPPVYLRWRGEHRLFRLVLSVYRGLSPLARGTLQERIRQRRQGRFIPAGAGNTLRDIASRGLIHGLSPLARGTLRYFGCFPPPARFIPAGAGNTGRSIEPYFSETVYPRWRGEHTKHT